MTYAGTRDDETLFRLGPAIDAFIAQCRKPADPDSPCARQTVFFFPGGMASRLMRATQKCVDGATGPAPRFNYHPVWMKPATLSGGFESFDDPKFVELISKTGFRDRMPNIARRSISDVMKRPGPEGLRPPRGDGGGRGPQGPPREPPKTNQS